MGKVFLGIFLFFAIGAGIIFFTVVGKKETPPRELQAEILPAEPLLPAPMVDPEPKPIIVPQKPWASAILYPVPFVSQAPTGEWGRSEFQNGCEEAAVYMVALWRLGKTTSIQQAKEELITLARFQEQKIGQAIDTDAEMTATLLLDGYYEVDDYELRYDFTLEELIRSTTKGVVIVPTNGRLLGNPNFTPPGPLQHMVVIIGYDPESKEFITNDPGTRKGSGYRYSENILFEAIREYPTGSHVPIKGERKALIVIPPVPTD